MQYCHIIVCVHCTELSKESQYNEDEHYKSERFSIELILLHNYLVFLQFYSAYV